jgi:hypothetical protein
MTFVRLASILLVPLSLAACIAGPGAGDDDGGPAEPCPATGDPLLPELPRVQPAYTDGCEDDTWAMQVEAEATWTIALQTGVVVNTMTVVPSADGVVAIGDRTARWATSAGEIVSERDLGSAPGWSRVQGSFDGVLVLSGSTGGSPFYRVLDASGTQVWLRLLDGFGAPTLWLEGGDVLLGTLDFTNDTVLRIERWGITGSKKGELVLPAYNDRFVRDGMGRYAVTWGDATVQVFASDGTPLGDVAVGFGEWPSVFQIVGSDDGFYAAGGEVDAFVSRITVGSQAEVAWTYRLGDPASEWEYAQGLAALPDGGVVAVGMEYKIRVTYPMSPLGIPIQPFVLALDAEGEPMWGERIGAPGQAMAVTVGAEGEVYVAGTAQYGPAGEFGGSSATWLRRYDP